MSSKPDFFHHEAAKTRRYTNNCELMSWTGAIISALLAIGSLALFFEWLTFGDLMIGGPLFLILYLLNAYLGLKLTKHHDYSTSQGHP